MSIELSQTDFDKLVLILSQHGEWQAVRARIDFMADVFAGSPRKWDILTQLDLDGSPRGTAVRVIQRLTTFGQDEPGRESVGVLINKLIAHLGHGRDAEYLRNMIARYPLATRPVAAHGIATWHGRDTDHVMAEKIIGENTLRDIYVLEVLLQLSRAVARIRGPNSLGTGFLVADDLLMTNNHVIGAPEYAEKCDLISTTNLPAMETRCRCILPGRCVVACSIQAQSRRTMQLRANSITLSCSWLMSPMALSSTTNARCSQTRQPPCDHSASWRILQERSQCKTTS